MTPQQRVDLRVKSWLNRAKTARLAVACAVANALGKPEANITFTDLELTEIVSRLFADRSRQALVIEVPNRAAAIELAKTELLGVTGPGFLLPRDYDECGVVPLDFADAILHLAPLLAGQQEIFRMISNDGATGLCISTQEGAAEFFSRYISVWKNEPLASRALTTS